MSEYPNGDELLRIKEWNATDFVGLMEYIRPLWAYSDCGYWEEESDKYRISTGGWSGNEDIIGAMQENYVWWSLYWMQSSRGGHYMFENRKLAR